MSAKEFGINIHEEWKGMTQPVGLVVEPTVLDRLGIFPEQSIKVVSDLQLRLESLLEDKIKGDKVVSYVGDIRDFFIKVLGWQDGDLLKPDDFYSLNNREEIFVNLEDYGEILKPDWIVPENNLDVSENKVQILIKELDIGKPFDQIINKSDNTKQWEATHQQRFERLLKETGNPVGILWNGEAIRLVYAPRGESSGYITFPLEPMILVDGRPLIGALEMLLGPDRLFEGGSSNLRLRNLMELSRKEQNEVSTRLSEQVLEALWILVQGFDNAEQKMNQLGKTILSDLSEQNPSHIYGGLITVLLRLVFLLYSEDEELMPQDSLYVENYSVSGLAAKLRNDRSKFQGAMQDRHGAWGSLLSLFRLVFDGGGPYESYLPARHGELFDPDAFPFLEGRKINSSYLEGKLNLVPLITDDVIERVLSKLLILDGQILSYRSLDVEQIGSVYEGIMGFNIEKTINPCVGIQYRPPRQKVTITIMIDSKEFLAQLPSNRDTWLKESTGVDLKLSSKIKRSLKEATNLNDICQSLEHKLSAHTPRGLDSGSLILQPNEERRGSGSHYTPRSLTEPIVSEALRPFLERCNYQPAAEDILNLKVCDPAMGSGAFLVATCRYLANFLVKAWEREGFPPEFDDSYEKDIYARRLIAQNCLYGVDKNVFAVSLAKLSLWLVTLSKDLPFTFVDHSLRCGNSLLGLSVSQIEKASSEIQLSLIDSKNQFLNKLGNFRKESFSSDNRNDKNYELKKKLLKDQIKSTEKFREVGDMAICAFFSGKNNKDRLEKQQIYLSLLSNSFNDLQSKESVLKIRKKIFLENKGMNPFHWDLEFPEVFNEEKKGFDLFIGNPPFVGGKKIKKTTSEKFPDWLNFCFPESNANSDLSAFFFLRFFPFLAKNGCLSFIATNTIYQGDTRNTGLKWICENDGQIFSARKRFQWPGQAAVIVSIIHIINGSYSGRKYLNLNAVKNISSFLLTSGGNEDPKILFKNTNKSFSGSILLGMGFTFSDANNSSLDIVGTPTPLKVMQDLFLINNKNREVIFPYIGGEEVNNDPFHKHHRYSINLGKSSQAEAYENWPEIMSLLEKKVKPERLKKSSDVKKYPWWQHLRPRNELYEAIEKLDKVLVTNAQASTQYAITFLPSNCIFANSLNIFPFDSFVMFSILQSRIHEEFARYICSTLKDDLRYNPTDCFETFPFPLDLSLKNDSQKSSSEEKLNKIGAEYFELRSKVMIDNKQGLTSVYKRFNDPFEEDQMILDLRNLHQEIDREILGIYGWNDISTNCGFGVEFLPEYDESKLSSEMSLHIEKDEILFMNVSDARSFAQKFNEIVNKNKRLNWRYRWPKLVKEKVLALLLELNERYYLEQSNYLLSQQTKNHKVNKLKNSFSHNQKELDLS